MPFGLGSLLFATFGFEPVPSFPEIRHAVLVGVGVRRAAVDDARPVHRRLVFAVDGLAEHAPRRQFGQHPSVHRVALPRVADIADGELERRQRRQRVGDRVGERHGLPVVTVVIGLREHAPSSTPFRLESASCWWHTD